MAHIEFVEPTPNPLAYKLILDQKVTLGVTRQYSKKEDAFENPLAVRFFDVHGVESVFFLDNVITVNKTQAGIWDFIFFMAQDIVMSAGEIVPIQDQATIQTAPNISYGEFEKLGVEEKLSYIDKVFDEAIRPGLARDGGGLKIIGLKDNVLTVKYQGACGSCPSSTAQTLTYISNIVQSKVSPTLQVQPA